MSGDTEAPDYRKAQFMLGVARMSQCPDDSGAEIAFAGRSNAGKSSAINAICDRNKLARASKTPGRTQQINFFALGEQSRLVDLPGYGYARAPEEVRRQWGRLVETYLRTRRSLVGTILVMDIRHPLKPQDSALIDSIVSCNKPLHILLTKADKLARGAAKSTLLATRRELAELPGVTVQSFSATNGDGVAAARSTMDMWFQAALAHAGMQQP